MDTQLATTVATAIVGIIAPVLTQIFKRFVPPEWVQVFSLIVSVVLGLIAVGVTGGFASGYTVAAVILAVVAVSQIIYSAINKAVAGNLSKDHIETTGTTVAEEPVTEAPVSK